MNEGEGDEMKAHLPHAIFTNETQPPRHFYLQRIFVEGDPILLAITGCVSVLHTVFDMLRQTAAHTPQTSHEPQPQLP